MDQISDLSAFAAVAETRSFSAAARRLQFTTAGVSKAIIRLETRLSARLFTRTTRRVVLTREGEKFYASARSIIDQIAEAEAGVSSSVRDLGGLVSVSAPVLIGQQILVPLLSEFRLNHPNIMLDVNFSDTYSDLVEDGMDLALRLGELDDSRLVARRLAPTKFCTCASPAYLARFGVPRDLRELSAHTCVTYVVQGSGKPFAWRFSESSTFMPDPSVLVRDGGANRSFAIAGLGLIQEIDVAVRADLRAKTLIEVLGDFAAPGPPLSLIQPAGRFVPRRVRAVCDYLAASFSL